MRKIVGIILTIFGLLYTGFFIFMGFWFIIEGIHWRYPEYDVIAKMFGFALIGIPVILIGVHLIQKPKEKKESTKKDEQYIVRVNGELYVKLGGDYFVGYNYASRVVVVGICIFFIAMTIFLFSEIWITTHEIEWLLLLAYIGFNLFMFYINYVIWRPRIEVHRNMLTCFPRFQKKRVIDYDYITYRRVEAAEMNLFTIFRNSRAKPTFYKITYFHEFEEIISITTNIQNAIRFDSNIIHHMIKNGYIHLNEDEKKENS